MRPRGFRYRCPKEGSRPMMCISKRVNRVRSQGCSLDCLNRRCISRDFRRMKVKRHGRGNECKMYGYDFVRPSKFQKSRKR